MEVDDVQMGGVQLEVEIGVEVDGVQMGGIELEVEIGVEVDGVQMDGVELELEIGVEVDDVQMGGVELDDIKLDDLSITEDTKLLLKGFEPLSSIVEICKVVAEVDSFSLTVTVPP